MADKSKEVVILTNHQPYTEAVKKKGHTNWVNFPIAAIAIANLIVNLRVGALPTKFLLRRMHLW